MRNRHKKIFNIRHVSYRFIVCSTLIFLSLSAKSQITVYQIQGFDFGTFYQGNTGGTVHVSNTGSRTATGDIVLLNSGPSIFQAAFDIEAPQGSIISIGNEPNVTLTGSNGGSITLQLGIADTGSPFNTTAVPPALNRVQLGGTIIIGDRIASPPGNYQGTFTITFYQE